jgi:ribose 5-phosphate isomerase A
MRVGLGTGSTVRWSIVALGERPDLDLTCVATSAQTESLALSLGLRLVAPDDVDRLDVAIDGADEVDAAGNLTKGGGGALTREKIVAELADRFIVVVDDSKLVERLGSFGTPVEVLPFAPLTVARRLERLGADTVARRGAGSDNGNLLLDAHFGPIADPAALAGQLAAVPGLVEHGLFLAPTVARIVIAGDGGVRERLVTA